MKDFQKIKSSVLKELEKVLEEVNENDIDGLVRLVLDSRMIFVAGAGRTMLMCRAFAKRLFHLGINAHVVGETVTPPLGTGDLIIACSSSGETMSTVNISKLGKSFGGKIVSITSGKNSSLCGISDLCIYIPCMRGSSNSVQPMSSLFEQALLIVLDCIVLMVKRHLKISEEEMQARHANLE